MRKLRETRRQPGPIVGQALYPVSEFMQRMGWSESAYRAARQKGLKVHRVGKYAYVHGQHAIEFVTESKAE